MTKVKILKDKLKNIQTYIDNLDNSELRKIDTDILLEKIRNIYEEIIDLQTDSNSHKNTSKAEYSETISNNIIIEETQQEVKTKNNSLDRNDLIDFSLEEESREERIKKNTETDSLINFEEDLSTQQDKQATLFSGKTNIIGERLGQNKLSLNESFAERAKQKDISNSLKPISDIRLGIGVGDRFLFVRELFEGNVQKFEQEIELLNSLSSYNEAINHLDNNYHWDRSSSTVSSFISLVKRKFQNFS